MDMAMLVISEVGAWYDWNLMGRAVVGCGL